jgi:hypothetical protein
MNCLGYIQRPKTLHYQRPSEAERRKDSTEYLTQLGLFTPTTATQRGVKKEKNTTSAKETTSVAPSEPAPKRQRVKVLTHRPRYIEPATVPEFAGETSSATEAKDSTLLSEIKELIEVPATEKMGEPRTEEAKTSEVSGPSAKVETGKSQMGPTVTPKRKRMVNVLDVLETIKSSSITPKKTLETSGVSTEAFVAEASKQQPEAEAEAGPSEPTKEQPLETEEKATKAALETEKMSEPILVEEVDTAALEAPSSIRDYIVRHASGKKLSEEEIYEADHYARELKYPKGALVFNGTNEDDFLYCLPDNKELSVCRRWLEVWGFRSLKLDSVL